MKRNRKITKGKEKDAKIEKRLKKEKKIRKGNYQEKRKMFNYRNSSQTSHGTTLTLLVLSLWFYMFTIKKIRALHNPAAPTQA